MIDEDEEDVCMCVYPDLPLLLLCPLPLHSRCSLFFVVCTGPVFKFH